MQPNNIQTVFLNGFNVEYLLFKTAIHFAEMGHNVWYISQERIKEVPKKIEPPDAEILKLLTFLYLKDKTDLINHLNQVHTWYRCPRIIILAGFNKYCGLSDGDYNPIQAAFLTAILLDAVSACAKKHNSTAFLLVSCLKLSEEKTKSLQKLVDLYFPTVISKEDKSDEDIFNKIVDVLKYNTIFKN